MCAWYLGLKLAVYLFISSIALERESYIRIDCVLVLNGIKILLMNIRATSRQLIVPLVQMIPSHCYKQIKYIS